MISLTCTGCRSVLRIDDGFVGGVCRCQHCGAIQTVPSDLKKGATEKKVKSQKTLYRKSVKHEGGVPSSGLDELAEVISSSGLSPNRLREMGGRRRLLSRRALVLMGGLAGAVMAAVTTAWFMMPASSESASSGIVSAAAVPIRVEPVVQLPNFCGVALDGATVVYVLDRGSGTAAFFDYLKEATLKSIESLGREKRFQIIFWNNGSDDAFPVGGPAPANTPNIEAARKAVESIFAHGQSDVGTALSRAVAASPQQVVLATGKGAQLDDSFVNQCVGILGGRSMRLHTFDLGSTEVSPALRGLAERTGGTSKVLSEGDLKRLIRE